MEALDTAELSSLLSRLTEGLDTFIGPRGNAYLEAKRQRVALARSILQNRPCWCSTSPLRPSTFRVNGRFS